MSVRFRNVFGETRVCPWLGSIKCEPGETINVPDEQYENWLVAGWEPIDPDPNEPPAVPGKAKSTTKPVQGSEK